LTAYGKVVSDHDGVVARAQRVLHAAGGALLIDFEFTCWEDSLRTDWADPVRPAELIELGLAAYRTDTRTVTTTFSTFVRPQLNPTLSAYCTKLLQISQRDVDDADPLPSVVTALDRWVRALPPNRFPTCGWGPKDRNCLAANAKALGVRDPLADRAHLDLRDVMTALYGHPTPITRDHLRALQRLPANPRRHRALDDAMDLIHFVPLLLDAAPSTS